MEWMYHISCHFNRVGRQSSILSSFDVFIKVLTFYDFVARSLQERVSFADEAVSMRVDEFKVSTQSSSSRNPQFSKSQASPKYNSEGRLRSDRTARDHAAALIAAVSGALHGPLYRTLCLGIAPCLVGISSAVVSVMPG